MADFLKDGMTWLAGQLKQHVSQTATYYRRGIGSNPNVQVTLGESEFPVEASDGLTTEQRSQDFLITAADLTLSAVQIEPEPGDQIEIAGLGTFEVEAPGGAEPAWRWSDPNHIMLRVHTREI